MINLYEKFKGLNRSIHDCQYPINSSGAIKAYYGIDINGFFRLSFLSTKNPECKGETKNIQVIKGTASEGNFWTCFNLQTDSLLSVFCTFGEDMVSCVISEPDESKAAALLRKRYSTWVALFKKNRSGMAVEKAKGLFGELYVLKNVIIPIHGVELSVKGWSGPDKASKDFFIGESWDEVKTTSPTSPIVKIASIDQLDSDKPGKLLVVRAEDVSDAYNGDDCNINKLCQVLLPLIKSQDLKDDFLKKISEYGFDFCDEIGDKNYDVKRIERFNVTPSFPAIRANNIPVSSVNNLSYELVLSAVKDFMEE